MAKQTIVSENTTYIDNSYSRTEYSSGIQDLGLKTEFEWDPNTHHSFRTGGNVTHHTFRPGVASQSSSFKKDTTTGNSQISAMEFAFYVEDDYKITRRWRANIGIHTSGFLVDQTFYKSIQPRISIRYLFPLQTAAKVSYSSMVQFIHLLANSGAQFPTDLWVPATKKIKPQESQQIALGIVKEWKNNTYETSIEAYYKTMNNVIQYKSGASYIALTESWENKVLAGNSTSYGIEFLIQKKKGKFTGWIGYTLSKTERVFEQLNNGKPFPYRYDRRHDISVVAQYQIKKGINISATWVLSTGNAITLPQEKSQHYKTVNTKGLSEYDLIYHPLVGGVQPTPEFSDLIASTYLFTKYDTKNSLFYYGSVNSYRIQSFHRMDININFTKKFKWGERTCSVGAYNLYNRANTFYISLEYTPDNNPYFLQHSLFPIIPYFNFSISFK